MNFETFLFAGGGTAGHIYPAIAVAEKIIQIKPSAKIHFFCSDRPLDQRLLSQNGFEYTVLPAKPFTIRPDKLIGFCSSFFKSFQIAKRIISESKNTVITGTGGFVSVPVCLAGYNKKIPIMLLNVDIVPGRANKLLAYFADRIFVQFNETADLWHRAKAKLNIVGCPLRSGFEQPEADNAIRQLGLDKNKKILLVTGASSGSQSINNVMCSLLKQLGTFADQWQIVHLTGRAHLEKVEQLYSGSKFSYKVLDYYDDMPNLLYACDLVVGRSGAVSIAEYAAASVPGICIPYPHHKDKHQYRNAAKLVEANAAVIVDDKPNPIDTSQSLAVRLKELMADNDKRERMSENCANVAKKNAALKIAETLLANKI